MAPNLSALIGEIVGARLISHAGSLTNLAKYPASTVQILGMPSRFPLPSSFFLLLVHIVERVSTAWNLLRWSVLAELCACVRCAGAEKALFRALKTKGNTPKYGLIFHSSFIGRASQKNKGRISRYLANKCSIASRIDCFSETLSTVFGEKMKDQVPTPPFLTCWHPHSDMHGRTCGCGRLHVWLLA